MFRCVVCVCCVCLSGVHLICVSVLCGYGFGLCAFEWVWCVYS